MTPPALPETQALYGLQPVLEALRAGREIRDLYLARGAGGATQKVRREAESRRVRVIDSSKEELTRRAGTDRHQGVVAIVLARSLEAVSVEHILERAAVANEDPLILVLDGIQDPQNLGALIRSAHGLGAHGVVIPDVRAAQVTPAVVRASAGAALHIPIAMVTNVKHALDIFEARNIWSVAAALDGEPLDSARLDGALAVVIGSEGRGVRPTVHARCDRRVAIPLAHGFDSLNASVAGGILLYEVARQRRARSAKVDQRC